MPATLSSSIAWIPLDREFPADAAAVLDAVTPVSCDPLTLEETSRALNQQRSEEAPGSCGVRVYLFRYCGILEHYAKKAEKATILWLNTLFRSIWKMESHSVL